jgi:hypothetical protein
MGNGCRRGSLVVERSKLWTTVMKPTCPSDSSQRQFPFTDCFFQAGFGEWRGFSPPEDRDDRSRCRNFQALNREFLAEFARERTKEMVVFGLVVLTAMWPVVYMVVMVANLLWKGRG